ncbi:hypothetical protein MRX96_054427 [Rhipicephalus microplus]
MVSTNWTTPRSTTAEYPSRGESMSATTYNVLHTDWPRHDRVAGNVPSNLRRQRPGPINRSLSGLSRSTGHPAKLGDTTETSAPRPKVVGFIEDVVRQYSDHKFRRHFRLARPVAEKLVAEFAVSTMCPSSTHGGVQAKSAETHVLTFIWYAANKTCMRDVASRFDMSESTVYRVLQRVAQFLMTLGPSVIKFPADLENLTSSFEKMYDTIWMSCPFNFVVFLFSFNPFSVSTSAFPIALFYASAYLFAIVCASDYSFAAVYAPIYPFAYASVFFFASACSS